MRHVLGKENIGMNLVGREDDSCRLPDNESMHVAALFVARV
jgi:hypothetical protein